MPEILDWESLEKWLEDRSAEDVTVIAARAGLRGLPGLTPLFTASGFEDPLTIVLPVFRASAVASVAANGPTQRRQVQDAAVSAHAEVSSANSTFSGLPSLSPVSAAHFAARSARSACSVISTTDNAALSAARSASHSARSADAAVHSTVGSATRLGISLAAFLEAWSAVDADVSRLTEGIDHPALLATPLWPEDQPQGLAESWPKLRGALLTNDPLWRVWTDWYQDRLDGKPMNVALELEKALIPDDDWEQGPAHVNAIIVDLIAKHASSATPQAEVLSLDPATGKVTVERTDVRPRSNLENICDKIRDRIEDLKPRVETENQFTALRPVIEKLERTVSKYADRPRRLHDDFARAFVNTQSLLTSGELAPDLEVDNLQADLQDSVDDLRAEYPEVDQMARARTAARIERLNPEDREDLEKAAEAAADISEPDLAEEIGEDTKAIVDAPDEAALKEGLPDGEEKDAGYRLGGRLLRIWRLVSSKEKINEVLTNAKDKADLITSLTGAGTIISGAIWAILRLVGF